MSDDETSGSDSESVDVQTTGLIATRAKRSTAGNLYASLRAHIDDEDLQRDLLAEDDDDVGDYEGSDEEDDDEAMESSSDEEDAGPPQEGEAEDLEGEKELKKAERVEQRKKRKVQDARLKVPAWQNKSKRVKLADDVKAEDGATAPKPKKKSERANWLPTEADAPTRQSRRSLAVANREVTHANLEQSFQRSEKQRQVMAKAAQREKQKKRAELDQEKRMEKCAAIAKQTEKEFGRWERDEAERQRLRDEALAAKRAKGLEGPFVRHWSGSVLWVGNQIKQSRMLHGSKKVEEIVVEAPKVVGEAEGSGKAGAPVPGPSTTTVPASTNEVPGQTGSDTAKIGSSSGETTEPIAGPSMPSMAAHTHPITSMTAISSATPATTTSVTTSTNAPVPWLQGIHDYASQPVPTPPAQQPAPPPYTNPYANPTAGPSQPQTQPAPPGPVPPPTTTINYQTPSTYSTTWPPGSQSFALNIPPQAPPAPVPQIREQAQRSLIMLEQFDHLDAIPKRTNKTAPASLEPTDTAKILLPESYAHFTPEAKAYLLGKHNRKGILPAPPAKARCAIVPHQAARYFDPRTRLYYSDLATYRIVKRVLAGGCQWSGLLGCWVGPTYGSMGRAATGVPEGFMRAVTPAKVVEKEVEKGKEGEEGVVKVEGEGATAAGAAPAAT